MTTEEYFRDEDQPVSAEVKDDRVWVTLKDGRLISTPLEWYPRLLDGTPEERNNIRLMYDGMEWPDLDEHLSVRGMLKGNRPPQRAQAQAAAD